MLAVLLERLLPSLDIHVEPIALCEVSPGRRLLLPGLTRTMLHFVLTGSGLVRSTSGRALGG